MPQKEKIELIGYKSEVNALPFQKPHRFIKIAIAKKTILKLLNGRYLVKTDIFNFEGRKINSNAFVTKTKHLIRKHAVVPVEESKQADITIGNKNFNTRKQLISSSCYDDEQGQELGVGEHVLHPSRPLDVVTIHECQNT